MLPAKKSHSSPLRNSLFWVACTTLAVCFVALLVSVATSHQSRRPLTLEGTPSAKGPIRASNAARRNEEAVVKYVIDGDTVVLSDGRHVRYLRIDTPERGEPGFDEARRANERLVLGKEVTLSFHKERFDTYGRTLAEVFVDGQSVTQLLLDEGHDKPSHHRHLARHSPDHSE